MVVTTTEAKGAKRSFFSIYKPGQGKYVRWGTVIGAAMIILVGAAWVGEHELGAYGVPTQATGVMIWIALGAILTFWVVNKPNLAEFMIMTESEMRKVSWPSRRVLISSTKVVIFMTLLLAGLLWLVDVGFKAVFEWLHIL
jgi:preprotein translocase subunit SecE